MNKCHICNKEQSKYEFCAQVYPLNGNVYCSAVKGQPPEFIYQPERSKREDSQKCGMRCSEHCGNTVRDK